MVNRVSPLPAVCWVLLIAWLLCWASGCSDSAGNGDQPPGSGYPVCGEGFQVRGNTLSLELYEGTASAGAILIGLGFFFDLVETTLGASLDDSVVENNLFSGSVAGPTILFGEFVGAGAEPNESHGSVIDVGPSFTTLEAEVGLEIAPMVHDNQFIGDFGTVVDQSMGANEFL